MSKFKQTKQRCTVDPEQTALGHSDKADFLEDSGRFFPYIQPNAFYSILSLD